MSIIDLFQGIATMFEQSPEIVIARIVLILLGFLLVYLGINGTLEPLIMVPMGLGMSAVNAGMLFLENDQIGNLIINPLLSSTDNLMKYMQIDFLQPVYTLTFSNGLIACLVFMGIVSMCDIGYVLERPQQEVPPSLRRKILQRPVINIILQVTHMMMAMMIFIWMGIMIMTGMITIVIMQMV